MRRSHDVRHDDAYRLQCPTIVNCLLIACSLLAHVIEYKCRGGDYTLVIIMFADYRPGLEIDVILSLLGATPDLRLLVTT